MAKRNRPRPRSRCFSAVPRSAVRRLPRPRVEIDRGLAWFALWTAPRAERRAQERLSAFGLATYLPVEATKQVRRGRPVEIERPAVSRYLFVGLDAANPEFNAVHEALEEGARGWFATVGGRSLGRLLLTEDGPLRVPVGALQRLADGLVVYDSPKPSFAAGGRFTAKYGPFAGLTATVESATDYRVRALVQLLGGRVPVEFDVDQLEAA